MKILYILSSPRGGSTLLSYILGRNSRATNLGEVSFLPKLLSLSESCSCGEDLNHCPEWGKVFSFLSARDHTDLRDDPYGFFIGEVIKRGGGKIDTQRQTAYRKLLIKYRSVFDRLCLEMPKLKSGRGTMMSWSKLSVDNTHLLYQAASATWNRDVIIDASKLNRKGLDLYRCYPDDVRLLHLKRDGRGVSASRKSVMSVSRAAQQWRKYHEQTLRWTEKWVRPEHRMSMSYEEIVDNPELNLGKICQWIGIDFEPAMIDFSIDIETHFAGGNLPARSKIGSGIRRADEKWRATLSEDELASFDRIAGSMNSSFGYL